MYYFYKKLATINEPSQNNNRPQICLLASALVVYTTYILVRTQESVWQHTRNSAVSDLDSFHKIFSNNNEKDRIASSITTHIFNVYCMIHLLSRSTVSKVIKPYLTFLLLLFLTTRQL